MQQMYHGFDINKLAVQDGKLVCGCDIFNLS